MYHSLWSGHSGFKNRRICTVLHQTYGASIYQACAILQFRLHGLFVHFLLLEMSFRRPLYPWEYRFMMCLAFILHFTSLLSRALLWHGFSSKGRGRSLAEAWRYFTGACQVLGKTISSSPEMACFCASLSHLEGLNQMNAQDLLAGCSLMLSPSDSLHQFGSKNSRFGVGVKIKYSSFSTVYASTGFLSTCGGTTYSIL